MPNKGGFGLSGRYLSADRQAIFQLMLAYPQLPVFSRHCMINSNVLFDFW